MFRDDQVQQLLRGVNPSRVRRDPRGMAHLEQWDVRAHLNRLFGFGGWDMEVTRLALAFETERAAGRYDVCYTASVRLTVRGRDGGACCYEDAATGFGANQSRGDAHDLALKSAVSTAMKRAATSLGDQFGLSLYRDDPSEPAVGGVLGYVRTPSGDSVGE